MGEIILPTIRREITRQNPRFMVLFGKPKVAGKTTAASLLEGNLIIEMEDRGADFVSGLVIDVRTTKELLDTANAIESAGKPYKYITLDTATAMEDTMIQALATKIYKNTPIGKNYNDSDIRRLPSGAGWTYWREAFNYIIDRYTPLCDCLILLAHCNETQIDKAGKEMFEFTMDISGKLKRSISAKADAIGFLYRKGNQTIVNFNGGEDLIVGARSEHLANRELVLVEKDEKTGLFKHNWDQIFI
jgi:hypothetical protein